jgi:hypothetical protein
MTPQIIASAKSHLQRAQDAVFTLQLDNISLEARANAWWAFLLAASGIYSKLEQGSKSDGKSKAWFGRAKQIRKTDELLAYLHHARNCEKHGLDQSTKSQKLEIVGVEGDGITMLPPDPEQASDVIKLNVASNDGRGAIPIFKVALPGMHLQSVTNNRSRDTYHPPKTHLGREFKSRRPREVAEAGLAYLEGLIAEAEGLVSQRGLPTLKWDF